MFDEIRSVWIADETVSRVFDISSQSKTNRRKSMLIKTGYKFSLFKLDNFIRV